MTVSFPHRLGSDRRARHRTSAWRSLRRAAARLRAARTAWWSLGVAALLLHPYPLFHLIGAREGPDAAVAGEWCILLSHIAMGAAAILLFCDWRLSRTAEAGVLGATLTFVAIEELPFSLARVVPSGFDDGYQLTVMDLVIAAAAAAVIARTVKRPLAPLRHPFAIGVALGALVLVIRTGSTGLGWDPALDLTETTHVALAACVTILITQVAVLAFRSEIGSGWAWRSVAVVLTVWYVARLATSAADASPAADLPVLLVVVTATLLFAIAHVRLTRTVTEARERLIGLTERVSTAEADLKRSRELVHEVNDAIAAIAAGSGLLAHEAGPTGPRRGMLAAMVDAEVSRLTRMVSPSGRGEDDRRIGVVDLDEVMTMVATAQRALGRPVSAVCRGHRVLGDRDAIAEVLTLLLNNAARHAPGADTLVSSRAVGDRVEIRVSDRGPGVAAPLVATLFSWGTRTGSSPGQGIGLHVARRLMAEQRGTLDLEANSHRPGATFVATLPAATGARSSMAEPPTRPERTGGAGAARSRS